MGIGIGLLFYAVFPPWPDSYWGVVAYVVAAGVPLSAAWLMERPAFRWNLENLRKGRRGGDSRRPACRIRPHRRALRRGPCGHRNRSGWRHRSPCRHTGSRLGDRNEVQEGAQKIVSQSAESESRRIWPRSGNGSPPGRRCGAASCSPTRPRSSDGFTSHGKEQISVYTRDSLGMLIREIREEARDRQSLDKHVAKDIWKLGRVAEGVIDP